jgi:hypothetical protein
MLGTGTSIRGSGWVTGESRADTGVLARVVGVEVVPAAD